MHPSPVSPMRAGTLVLSADDPDLVALTNRLSGGGRTVMLGGTMSRNVHLVDAALVLRVHAPFVRPARVRAERRLRHILLDAGLTAAKPRSVTGEDLLWVAGRGSRRRGRAVRAARGTRANARRPRIHELAYATAWILL